MNFDTKIIAIIIFAIFFGVKVIGKLREMAANSGITVGHEKR